MSRQQRDVVIAAVPRVTLTLDEAAASLGVSRDHFDRHVRPQLRLIETGARIVVRVAELERWAERHEAIAR